MSIKTLKIVTNTSETTPRDSIVFSPKIKPLPKQIDPKVVIEESK